MIKAMIVDDEPLVRLGMRSIIPWEKHGITIVGEAQDGEQALSLAREWKPDIILLDIAMPKMNGLEFIQAYRKEAPACRYIILSCHNEVAYLQQAMRLGVKAYVIKSMVEPNQILDEVIRVVSEMEQSENTLEHDVEEDQTTNSLAIMNLYMDLVVNGLVTDPNAIRKNIQKHIALSSSAELYLIRCFVSNDDYWLMQQGRAASVATLMQSILSPMLQGLVLIGREEHLWMLLACNDDERQLLEDICHRINMTIQQYFQLNIFFGICSASNDLSDLPAAYARSGLALANHFCGHNNEIYMFERTLEFEEAEKKQREIVSRMADSTSFNQLLQQLDCFKKLVDNRVALLRKEIIRAIINGVEQIEAAGGVNADQIESISKLKKEIYHAQEWEDAVLLIHQFHFGKAALLPNHSMRDPIIDTVIHYIQENIETKIMLIDIGKSIHMNPDYLCRLFKKKTGENLMSYIQKYKIEQAKQLLLEGASITQTSNRLGFSTEAHFITCFRKVTGTTPGLFAKQ